MWWHGRPVHPSRRSLRPPLPPGRTCSTDMMMLLAPPGVLNKGSLLRSCGAISALYQLENEMNAATWGKPSPMALREREVVCERKGEPVHHGPEGSGRQA